MIKKEERVEGPKKEEKKEEEWKGSGIFPIPRILKKPPQEEKKKEEDKVEKDEIPKIKQRVEILEKEVPPIKEKANNQGEEITALKDRAKAIEDAIRQLQIDSSQYVPYWIFWVTALLLGAVGGAYIMMDFVFKTVTVWSYIIGIVGTALIATGYYLYKKGKAKNN